MLMMGVVVVGVVDNLPVGTMLSMGAAAVFAVDVGSVRLLLLLPPSPPSSSSSSLPFHALTPPFMGFTSFRVCSLRSLTPFTDRRQLPPSFRRLSKRMVVTSQSVEPF